MAEKASRPGQKARRAGRLAWWQITRQLWTRSLEHDLTDRAGLLSFYFLLAFFPLLLTFSALIGFVLSSQTDTYWRLLNYLFHFMPPLAAELLLQTLAQLKEGATGGKLSFGLLASLWSASSGVAALIEALNIAFAVPAVRTWWHRRLVAIGLTLAMGVLLTASLAFLLGTNTLGTLLTARLPLLNRLQGISSAVSWAVCGLLIFATLLLIYRFGPNTTHMHWGAAFPGAVLAFVGAALASGVLRLYLTHFGRLGQSYGSLAGVIALLFWLYLFAAAILLGGELNAVFLQKAGQDPAH